MSKTLANPTTADLSLSLHDNAAGSQQREQSDREKAVERVLIRASAAGFARRGGFVATLSDADRQEVVYAVLELIGAQNWRVHKAYPVCVECQREVDAVSAAVRARLENDTPVVVGLMQLDNRIASAKWEKQEKVKG